MFVIYSDEDSDTVVEVKHVTIGNKDKEYAKISLFPDNDLANDWYLEMGHGDTVTTVSDNGTVLTTYRHRKPEKE